MRIGEQKVNIENLKQAQDLVKEIMENMNEKELIFFSDSIREYINLRLMEK